MICIMKFMVGGVVILIVCGRIILVSCLKWLKFRYFEVFYWVLGIVWMQLCQILLRKVVQQIVKEILVVISGVSLKLVMVSLKQVMNRIISSGMFCIIWMQVLVMFCSRVLGEICYKVIMKLVMLLKMKVISDSIMVQMVVCSRYFMCRKLNVFIVFFYRLVLSLCLCMKVIWLIVQNVLWNRKDRVRYVIVMIVYILKLWKVFDCIRLVVVVSFLVEICEVMLEVSISRMNWLVSEGQMCFIVGSSIMCQYM